MRIIAVLLTIICCNLHAELVQISDLQIEKKEDIFLINFTANNVRFQGMIFQNAHAYSEGMLLDMVESNIFTTNNWGGYRTQITFFNPLVGDTFQAVSRWTGANTLIQKITAINHHFRFDRTHIKPPGAAPHSGGVNYLNGWDLEVTLEDGSVLKFPYPVAFSQYGFYKYPEYFRGQPILNGTPENFNEALSIIQVGDEIEMLSETSGDRRMRDLYQSHYRLKQIKTNLEMEAIGTTHFLEGFKND